MDYKQFIHILKDENPVPNSISMLNDYVNEFPYFQTAHSLLAREMFNLQHVRYEKQLKIAAAYAPDRKALYNLIHPKKTNLFSSDPVIEHPHLAEEKITENTLNENLFEIAEEKEIVPPDNNISQPIVWPEEDELTDSVPVTIFKEEIFEDEEEIDLPEEETPVSDPQEIIRKRLSEILGLHQPVETNEPAIDKTIAAKDSAGEEITETAHEPVIQKVTAENKIEEIIAIEASAQEEITETVPETVIQEVPAETKIEEIIATEVSDKGEIAALEPVIQVVPAENKIENKSEDVIDQLADESDKAIDVIVKGELEYALEVSLIQSLEKLPTIEKGSKNEEESPKLQASSFLDWLKSKAGDNYGKFEEVHAYDETPEQPKQEEKKPDTVALIDRFIKDEPKIVGSKAEFYSPSIQAKKSVTQHEDIVSETLAKIYHQQGNIIKARESYEKLLLFYPEKKAYFAALISAIDQEINQQNKQDL